MIEAWAITFILILVRVATFWMVVPVWSMLKPPRMVKLGLIISLTIFWFVEQSAPVDTAVQWANESSHWFSLIIAVVQEIFLGGMLGMAFHVFFIPMQIAGAYIGQELGLSMATQTNPGSGETNNILATLLQMFAMTAFFVLDLHHVFFYCLHTSFEFSPAGDVWRSSSLAYLIYGFAELTENGIAICAPIAIVSFVALVSLLALARAAPALNLFSVGMPVRLLIGIAAILIFLPQLVANMQIHFDNGVEFIESLTGFI